MINEYGYASGCCTCNFAATIKSLLHARYVSFLETFDQLVHVSNRVIFKVGVKGTSNMTPLCVHIT